MSLVVIFKNIYELSFSISVHSVPHNNPIISTRLIIIVFIIIICYYL